MSLMSHLDEPSRAPKAYVASTSSPVPIGELHQASALPMCVDDQREESATVGAPAEPQALSHGELEAEQLRMATTDVAPCASAPSNVQDVPWQDLLAVAPAAGARADRKEAEGGKAAVSSSAPAPAAPAAPSPPPLVAPAPPAATSTSAWAAMFKKKN